MSDEGLPPDDELARSRHVGENIKDAILSAEGMPTIELDKLPVDTIFEFSTASGSVYRIKKLAEDNKYLVLTGSPRYFQSPREVWIRGATFGTPMIMNGVIREGMSVEMALVEPQEDGFLLITSPAKGLRIVSTPDKKN